MRRRRERLREPIFSRETWRGFTSRDTIPRAEMLGGLAVNYTGKPPVVLSFVYLGVCGLNVAFVIALINSATHDSTAGIVASSILLLLFGSLLVLITFPMRRIWRFWLLARRHPPRAVPSKPHVKTERAPSLRWMRAGVRMIQLGAGLFAGSIVTAALHGPAALAIAFVCLMPVCALTGFVFVSFGARKARVETKELVAEALAENEQKRAARGH